MYPNDPFDQQPTGIDYLNQIAAPPPSVGIDKKTKIILAICGVIGIISIIMIATMAGNSGPSPMTLAGRLFKMQSLTEKYTPQLRNGDLQAANGTLNAILATANAGLVKPLADYGIDAEKSSRDIEELEPATEIEATLDDAYLNANLDSAYAFEMSLQIEETILMMQRLQRSTKYTSMKEFLEKTITDFENSKKQLSNAVGLKR